MTTKAKKATRGAESDGGGRRAQEAGAAFEEATKRVNEALRARGVARVKRIKTPVNIIGPLPGKKGIFKCVMSGEEHVDFEGTIKGGISVAFDTKHVERGASFPFADVRDSQVRYLREHARMWALAFLLVRCEGDEGRAARDYIVPVDARGRMAGVAHARSLEDVGARELRESVKWSELDIEGWRCLPGETWADCALRQLSRSRWPHQMREAA